MSDHNHNQNQLHPTIHGGIVVNDGPESPSKYNIEGQSAASADSAGEALAGPSRSDSNSTRTPEKEKEGGGGKPHMEKYAYHCESMPRKTREGGMRS
jgi:hypothetical protein